MAFFSPYIHLRELVKYFTILLNTINFFMDFSPFHFFPLDKLNYIVTLHFIFTLTKLKRD